ncbi:MAG: hypothetical protein ACIAXF_08620 [Phycisphaerales bacterium JB063]
MKTGLAICVFILAAVAGLLMLERREPVDQDTGATAEQKLVRSALPEDLPAIYEPGEPAVLGAGFDALLLACQQAAQPIASSDETLQIEHSDAVCLALQNALASGAFEDGFADRLVPPFDLYSDDLRQLFRVTMQAINLRFARLLEAEDYEAADRLARAHFELGRRVFTQNIRLRARQHGLGLMDTGLGQIRQAAQAEATLETTDAGRLEELVQVEEHVDAWEQAVVAIDSAWREKLDWISSARPNVADLIRVAELDADRSLRVYATHQLGYARFERSEPGNQRMIAQAIQRASESDDPLIRQAARFAQRMNREQFYTAKP